MANILGQVGFARCLCAAGSLWLASLGIANAGTLSGTVADYNAAKVAIAGGALTVPASVMTYTATASIPTASQLVITLPAGITFASSPVLSTSAGGVSLALTAGGFGTRSATFTTSGGAIAATNTVTFATSFTIAGATALRSVTPIANALPMTWQVMGVDPAPLSKGALASDYGVAGIFVGAIQFVDAGAPSNGTLWGGPPDQSTIVSSAIAIQTQTSDSATASVPILNPDGTMNNLNAADQAQVTLTGVFQGVGSAFSSNSSNCLASTGQALSLTPTSATFSIPINREVFFCSTASGQVLGVSDPSGTGDPFGAGGAAVFTSVTVSSPGGSTDFVAGAQAIIEFGGYSCATLTGSFSACIPWATPTASNVAINGTPQVGTALAGSYTYANVSGVVEGNSTFRWMSGQSAGGSDKTPIAGAITSSYSPVAADGGKYLFFCVTPVAQSGVLAGVEVCSSGKQLVLVSNITSPTTVTGIGPNQISPLDLSTGYGPTLTQCLMTTLRQLLGPDAVYLGQVSGGGTRVMQGGKIFSFYALLAGGATGQGLSLFATNSMNVGTACGNLDVTPALYNPTEFGAALARVGLTASIDATGVITVTGDGNVYVGRPDYVVTPGQTGSAGLKMGADGLFRFTDSGGNSQVLRPAFLSLSALQAGANAALGGYLIIQIDGTALFTRFNGPQSVLTADLLLGGIPAAFAQSNWWSDGPNHFRVPVGFGSQGLTQTAR